MSVLITTNGNTDATIGIGKVTVRAADRTFTCTTYTSRCYYEVPPGTPVIATASRKTGSECTYFYLIWEDHSTIESEDCSPINFTSRKQEALLVANFDQIQDPPPPTPTDAPATPAPTPADPPATPAPTPSPAIPPEESPAPAA